MFSVVKKKEVSEWAGQLCVALRWLRITHVDRTDRSYLCHCVALNQTAACKTTTKMADLSDKATLSTLAQPFYGVSGSRTNESRNAVSPACVSCGGERQQH